MAQNIYKHTSSVISSFDLIGSSFLFHSMSIHSITYLTFTCSLWHLLPKRQLLFKKYWQITILIFWILVLLVVLGCKRRKKKILKTNVLHMSPVSTIFCVRMSNKSKFDERNDLTFATMLSSQLHGIEKIRKKRCMQFCVARSGEQSVNLSIAQPMISSRKNYSFISLFLLFQL